GGLLRRRLRLRRRLLRGGLVVVEGVPQLVVGLVVLAERVVALEQREQPLSGGEEPLQLAHQVSPFSDGDDLALLRPSVRVVALLPVELERDRRGENGVVVAPFRRARARALVVVDERPALEQQVARHPGELLVADRFREQRESPRPGLLADPEPWVFRAAACGSCGGPVVVEVRVLRPPLAP